MTALHPRLFRVVPVLAVAFASGLAAAVTQSPGNEKLLAATESYEALTEAALDGKAGKIQRAIKAAEAERPRTRLLLAAEGARQFDDLFSSLTAAQKKKDNIAVALQSAELYKLLVSELDPSTLTVPKEVNLLDYCGFRTNALLKAAALDWDALRATAVEANGYWAKVRQRVSEKKLQAKMEKAQQGLAAAAARKDASLSASSARDNLDLVDDLERFFAK